ncbi:MAG: 5-formyltetrahydrofolate cyclo-ligase [Armatimonadetes bacterium]|nr:5-formyltetrahydrofolate cyclo-ligase [Armatimonadota bacterium]
MIPLEEQKKRALRQQTLERREALSAREIEEKSRAITLRVLQTDEWKSASVVMAYCAFNSEVRTQELLEAAVEQGKRLVLPRVNRGERRLDLYFVPSPWQPYLEPSTWGIMEPVPALCELADASEIELFIVPGVAFDAAGGRIGYGGGYYDRLLTALDQKQRQRIMGLCFEAQLVEEIPVGLFDFRIPIIVTEQRIIRVAT